MVAKPVGIRTVLSSVPLWTGHDGGDPRRYFKLGRFTMGNTDGFQFSHGIEYGQQLLYPMPAVWELLAYDIKNGASCLFQELVDVPDLSLKQPWDRSPLAVAFGGQQQLTGGQAWTTHWTYTVPTGRKLYVSHASVRMRRAALQTAFGGASSQLKVNGSIVLMASHYVNTIGAETGQDLSGGPMLLGAGAVLLAEGINQDTGGDVRATNMLSGFTFDA